MFSVEDSGCRGTESWGRTKPPEVSVCLCEAPGACGPGRCSPRGRWEEHGVTLKGGTWRWPGALHGPPPKPPLGSSLVATGPFATEEWDREERAACQSAAHGPRARVPRGPAHMVPPAGPWSWAQLEATAGRRTWHREVSLKRQHLSTDLESSKPRGVWGRHVWGRKFPAEAGYGVWGAGGNSGVIPPGGSEGLDLCVCGGEREADGF